MERPTQQCPPSVADETAALVAARLCGGRVAIDSATTETTTAVALPSGAVEQTVSAAPVRVNRNGSWIPIDLDLVRNADGTISPKAATSDLVLSGSQPADAEHELAAVGVGDRRMSIGWTGKLGEPILDGSRATYPDVLPGVDLQVQATRTGAETLFVVESADAAAQLDGVELPVTGVKVKSHRVDAGGNTTLLDGAGKPLATIPAPEMWDAEVEAGTGKPADVEQVPTEIAAEKAQTAKPAEASEGAGVTVSLGTDTDFFRDAATTYPVVVDPQVNPLSTTFDTYVKKGDTVDRSGANDLQLGIVSGDVARSFVHWDSSKLVGKQITAATLYFYNFWSHTCTANSWEIWSTGAASVDTRWSNQPAWSTKESTSTATKGNSACADGWVEINGTSFFQRAATANKSRAYMGIRATSETDNNAFKQFRSRNADSSSQVPYAVVTYNSYPVIATRSTTPTSACVTGDSRPYINSATPTLRAVVTDSEGSSVKGVFEWYNSAGTKIGGATTASTASGSTASTAVPAGAFANGSTYKWRVAGNDGTVGGAWSSFCEFTIDTAAPTTAPTVASSTYPAGGTGGAAGTAGTFTFAANGVTDAAAFLYGLDTNPPTTTVNANTLGGGAAVSITPTTTGAHTLYVRTRDRAGNLSPITSHSFTVNSRVGDVASPQEGALSAGKVVLSGSGAATSTGATYQWRRGEADPWVTVPAADVTRAAGGTAVTWPLASTGNGKFPGLTWNVESTVNAAEAGAEALDGPLQVRANFTGGTAGTSNIVRFSLDRNRGSAPTADMGVGEVNLLTGNLEVGATDAADAAGLGIGRTFNSRDAAQIDGMFGPGWVSSTVVSTADTYRSLTVVGSLAQVGTPDGDTLDFTKKANIASGAIFTPQEEDSGFQLEYLSSDSSYRLTDKEDNVTTFTRGVADPVGVFSPTSAVEGGTGETTVLSWQKAAVDGIDVVQPTRVVAPAPAGVVCKSDPLGTPGCKTLTYQYATATTATTSASGDYTGRLKEVAYTAFNPATNAMATVVLAQYSYDQAGRLTASWDPRLDYVDLNGTRHVATVYGYDANGILATVTSPGQEPWQLTYTTVPGDTGKGRLAKVTRSALQNGTATVTVVYGVPLTGSAAPADLSPAQTARWGQVVAPVDATAVFPATQTPTGNQATGTLPDDWRQATVSYLDGNGREVNTKKAPRGISTTWYDADGNVAQELTAANWEELFGDGTRNDPTAAANHSTIKRYGAGGVRLTETLGPEHDVVLAEGSTVRGRSHTVYRYDEGAKDPEKAYHLATTQIDSTQYWTGAGTTAETASRTTKTQYDWDLRLPTVVTSDPDGLALTTTTKYDSTGATIATTTPAGDGSTAATLETEYYRAGTGAGSEQCDSHPEWAGLVCRTGPAAQPTSDPEVPEKFVTYTMFDSPEVVTESNSSGVIRTTTTTYDTAGRPATVATAAGSSLGTAVETRRTIYHQVTGEEIGSEQVNADGTVMARISKTFDSLGRMTSYADSTGNTATNTYDLANRLRTVNDGKAVQTIGYDDTAQGLPNSIVDSQAGTFTGSYDADGRLVTELWPNGITVRYDYNEEGRRQGVAYLQGGAWIYSDSVSFLGHGQQRWKADMFSYASYAYDAVGRLASSFQENGNDCRAQTYTFDQNSNRTGMTSRVYGHIMSSCSTEMSSSSRTWSYDTADRVIGAGYTYDDLGRTLTLPAADVQGAGNLAVAYYANDMAREITAGTRRTTNTLDVMTTRFARYSITEAGQVTIYTNHYVDDSDSPAWIDEGSFYTRVISGLNGVSAQRTGTDGHLEWLITNLHGDVVAVTLNQATSPSITFSYYEYGIPATGQPSRYGYLGGRQRSSDGGGGLISMGVRLYNPVLGRFLSPDPVYGANANPYDYCAGDPLSCTDTSGMKPDNEGYLSQCKTFMYPLGNGYRVRTSWSRANSKQRTVIFDMYAPKSSSPVKYTRIRTWMYIRDRSVPVAGRNGSKYWHAHSKATMDYGTVVTFRGEALQTKMTWKGSVTSGAGFYHQCYC